MREHKFKAWDKHNKVWVGPYTLKQLADHDQFSYDREVHAICSKWECFEWVDYTGYKDRKGDEIYKGDILLYPCAITLVDQHVWPHKEIAVPASDHKLEVLWEDGSFVLRRVFDDTRLLLGVANIKEMEIIGNIYEHPEMARGDSDMGEL